MILSEFATLWHVQSYFKSDETLSRGSERGCRKPNKNIRIPVGAAYFIPRPLRDVT